jgi:hypothetical protein
MRGIIKIISPILAKRKTAAGKIEELTCTPLSKETPFSIPTGMTIYPPTDNQNNIDRYQLQFAQKLPIKCSNGEKDFIDVSMNSSDSDANLINAPIFAFSNLRKQIKNIERLVDRSSTMFNNYGVADSTLKNQRKSAWDLRRVNAR